MYKVLANSSEAFYASAYSVLGAKLLLDQRVINFGDIPVLSMLNGYDQMWLYGGTSLLSSLAMSYTSDFVGMFIQDKPSFQSLRKISKPISAGILSIVIGMIINRGVMSLNGTAQLFAFGAVSDVLGSYTSQVMFPMQSRLMDQLNGMSVPKVNVPQKAPIVDVPKFNPSSFAGFQPSVDFGFGAIF